MMETFRLKQLQSIFFFYTSSVSNYNVKELAHNDEPTKNYHMNLHLATNELQTAAFL